MTACLTIGIRIGVLLGAWLAMTLVERTEEQEAIGDDGYRRVRTNIVWAGSAWARSSGSKV